MDKKEVSILRQAQDDIPEEDSGESRKVSVVAAGVSAAAVLAMAKEADAATPFDDAVNSINSGPLREAQAAQLNAGPTGDRFDMVFASRSLSGANDFYSAQFRAEANPGDGGVIFRQLGSSHMHPASTPFGGGADSVLVEFVRPDGRRDIIRGPGFDTTTGLSAGFMSMNGEGVWPSEDCPGGYQFIHPSARTPRTLKVAVNFGEAFGAVDEDIYRVSIDAPVDPAAGVNFCTDIRDRIEAANALGPGHDVCTEGVLMCNAESIQWSRDTRAPETPEFQVHAAGDLIDVLGWNPATDQFDIYMQRNPDDGCYAPVCAPPYTVECMSGLVSLDHLGTPSALLTTPLRIDGRTIYPYAAEYTTPVGGEGPYPNGRPHLEAMAFEITPGGTICEVPVSMAADEAAVVDDDNDGIPNEDDTCAWVQESGNIDASGPGGAADGIGDACQTACENWPAVNPPEGTGPSDFWVCQSTEIQGYDHQLKRGDGSTLLTSFEVPDGEFDDGDIDLPPGGDFYWLHAQAAQYQGDEVPSPSISFPPGNSAHIEILSTDHPDGTPGTATFTHLPYPSGSAEETALGVGTHDFDPGLGDVLGLSGTVVRGSAGSENLPLECPPVCAPDPDGGTPDGGADGGAEVPDGGADAGGDGADAGTGTDAGPTCPPVCDPQPDAGTDAGNGTADGGQTDAGDDIDAGADPLDAGQDIDPADSGTTDPPDADNPDQPDANNPDPPDASDQSDANNPDPTDAQNPDPKPDSGPVTRFDGGPSHRTDAANTGHDEGSHNGGGCSCTISQPDRGPSAPLSMDGFFMMTPIIAALLMQRRRRFAQFMKTMFTANAE